MGWKDLTIKNYVNVFNAMNASYSNDETRALSVLSALLNVSIGRLESIPISELTKLINQSKFLYTEHKGSLPTYIKISGNKYLVESSITNLNSGQYIDLSTYCKSIESITANYHNIISIFVQPVDMFGRGSFTRMLSKAKTREEQIVVQEKIVKERAKIAELFYEDLTMDIVFSISNYFFLLSKNLIKVSLDYLEKEKKKNMKNLKKCLYQNGMQDIGDGL